MKIPDRRADRRRGADAFLARADAVLTHRWAGPAVLLVALFAAGAYSVSLGADANWDLHNYHLYNAYALLHGRLLWDIAPAGMQTYFHPLADLPFYLLVTAFPESPRAIAVVMAAPHAASAFFLFLIARRLFPPALRGRVMAVAAALAIGPTGAALLTTLGGTMNDYQVMPFVLGGLYAALRALAPDDGARPRQAFWLLVAGAALGTGTALKLTVAPYGAALAFATLCAGLPWRMAARALGLYLLGAAAAFAIIAGPWMIFLWDAFGSPLFPQFNDIFRSPYTATDSFRDTRWFPATLLEALAYPFFWAFAPSNRISEWPLADPRIAAALVALATGALALALRRPAPAARAWMDTNCRIGWRLVAGFFVAGYMAWLLLFGYARYMGPLELLAGLPIVGAIIVFAGGGLAGGGLSVAAALAILLATTYPPWQRLPFQSRYFTLEIPPIPPRSLVLLSGKPLAYVIALMPRDARFVAVANDIVRPGQTHRLAERAAAIVAAHEGPLYLIEFEEGAKPIDPALTAHRLERAAVECRPILDGALYGAKRLCPLRRASSP